MKVMTLGIDLAKSIFRIHGVDVRGAVVVRRQLTRKQVLPFLTRLEPCLVGMEACGSAHYWAREIGKLGHTAKLMSPHFVTPYRKSQKNDGNDAEAICEAAGGPRCGSYRSRTEFNKTFKRSTGFAFSWSNGERRSLMKYVACSASTGSWWLTASHPCAASCPIFSMTEKTN